MKRDIGTIGALCLLLSAPAMASDLDSVDSCLANALSEQTDPMGCVESASKICAVMAAEMPDAATACFIEGRVLFDQRISEKIALVSQVADETLTARAAINAKYNVLNKLIECDRKEELELLTEMSPDRIRANKAACQLSGSALALVFLHFETKPVE